MMRLIVYLQGLRIIKSFHLHRSRREDWSDSIYWLTSTVFAGLMPVWLPLVLLSLVSRAPSMNSFTQNGEFALISASLLSASAYIVTKESRWNFLRDLLGNYRLSRNANLTFPNQRFFVFITLIITVLSAVIYMGTLLGRLPEANLTLNTYLIHSLSIFVLLVTLSISFLITVVDNAFTNRPDIPDLRQESYEKLEERFEELEERDA